MNWQKILQELFPAGHQVLADGDFICGTGQAEGQCIAVIGTCNHAEIGVEIALRQARAVLDVVQQHPDRAILLLVDTQGQRLRHRDEMLGINSYMAHLAKCVFFARQQGHLVLSLVYDQALSGGFLSSGLMAQACYALANSSIRVMDLAAMSRITKIPLEQLQQLAQNNPVFAPGPENFERMGGIAEVWQKDIAQALVQALKAGWASAPPENSAMDERSTLGHSRGGRRNTVPILQAMLDGAQTAPTSA